ncbi:hypothetical protein R3P38DRAFT_3255945 [Favolaschia claudopus]|uniref:F-box domain-containing protein n=1 Tax=Favolaschia claudopus TaxID=2862362 RepID=A0AAW0DEG4_9AGAR
MMALAHNARRLHNDIVDRIMLFCSTFETLSSISLVSKSFYRVFQAHPKSIYWAVAYNVVGPSLPQAMLVVKYPYEDVPSSKTAPMLELTSPVIITPTERRLLQENSQLVDTVENIYSRQNKNRKSKTSVLTAEESLRFRRAMYRLIFYSKLFPAMAYRPELPAAQLLDEIREQRIAVLDRYPTEELQQLCSAAKFLRSMLGEASFSDPAMNDALLSSGPSGALMVWKYSSYDILEGKVPLKFVEDEEIPPGLVGYLSVPLEHIWTARQVTTPSESEPPSMWILDEVDSASDACSRCGTPDGFKLLCEANFYRFPVYLSRLFKGQLGLNTTIHEPFMAATGHLQYSESLGSLIRDLFSFRSQTAPAFDEWDPSDSYCFFCLMKFIEEHLWIWFFNKRIEDGWSPPDNCPDGYDCPLQKDDLHHVESKNHLCAPIQ